MEVVEALDRLQPRIGAHRKALVEPADPVSHSRVRIRPRLTPPWPAARGRTTASRRVCTAFMRFLKTTLHQLYFKQAVSMPDRPAPGIRLAIRPPATARQTRRRRTAHRCAPPASLRNARCLAQKSREYAGCTVQARTDGPDRRTTDDRPARPVHHTADVETWLQPARPLAMGFGGLAQLAGSLHFALRRERRPAAPGVWFGHGPTNRRCGRQRRWTVTLAGVGAR
jgi:hypothetical protein